MNEYDAREPTPRGRLLNRSPALAAVRAAAAERETARATVYDWSVAAGVPALQLAAFDHAVGDLHDAVAVGNHEVWGDPLPAHLAGGALQLLARRGRPTAEAMRAEAARGVRGGGGPLPYGELIQAAFGRHDLGGVTAHVGGAASAACDAIGARAYATGGDVAFASSPDLHTAAHEAAHVVQQRAGVALRGGVGQIGDVYERHADAVADRVVRGESAEALLDELAGRGAGAATTAVQGAPLQLREFENDPQGPGRSVRYREHEQRELAEVRARHARQDAALARVEQKMASLESLGDVVSHLKKAASKGQFIDARLHAAFPVASVPGLSVTVTVELSYAAAATGDQSAGVKLGGGVRYGLGSLFNVNAQLDAALTLRGADLGAALVDAVKQTIWWSLEQAGVHQQFAELLRLATEGPGFWDYAKLLVPIYNNYAAAELAISALGADKIKAAYAAMEAYFANDEAVGFEGSVGARAGVEARGATGGAVALESRVGLEDVDNKETRLFTEVAAEVALNKGNNGGRVRVARRAKAGGGREHTVDLKAQASFPKEALTREALTGAFTKLNLGAKIGAVVKALYGAAEGPIEAREALALIEATANMGGMVLGTNGHFDSLVGVDVNVLESGGEWTVRWARLKVMTQAGTGTNQSIAGVEANVQVGSFYDVTALVRATLNHLRFQRERSAILDTVD